MSRDTTWERADEEAHAAAEVASRNAAIAGVIPTQVPIDLSSDEESCAEHLANAQALIRLADLIEEEKRPQLVLDVARRIELALQALHAGRLTPRTRLVGRAS